MKSFMLVVCSIIVLACISCVSNSKPTQKVVDFKSESMSLSDSNTDYKYPKTDVIAWKFGSIYDPMQPVIGDGKLFIGQESRNLHCFDAFTGEQLWNENLQITGTPSFFAGSLYFGCADSNIVCMNVSDRKILWKSKTGSTKFGSAVNDGKHVYINASEGLLLCLDAKTGDKVWERKSSPDITIYVAKSENRIFVPDKLSMLCLDSLNGDVVWKTDCQSQVYNAAAGNGKVFFGEKNMNLHCVDIGTGKQVWTQKLTVAREDRSEEIDVQGMEVCVFNDKVFTISGATVRSCFNAQNGKMIWEEIRSDPMSSMICSDNKLYHVNASDVVCVDTKTGGDVWYNRVYEDIPEGLSLAIAYGNVYYSSKDAIYCFKAEDGSLPLLYKMIYTNPCQLKADGIIWAGQRTPEEISIFQNDKTIWKIPSDWKAVMTDYPGSPQSFYMEADDWLLILHDENEPIYSCIDKKSGIVLWEQVQKNGAWVDSYKNSVLTFKDNIGNIITIDDTASQKRTDSKKPETSETSSNVLFSVNGKGLYANSVVKLYDKAYLFLSQDPRKGDQIYNFFVINKKGQLVVYYDKTKKEYIDREVWFSNGCLYFVVHSEELKLKKVNIESGKIEDIPIKNDPNKTEFELGKEALPKDAVWINQKTKNEFDISEPLSLKPEVISNKTGIKPHPSKVYDYGGSYKSALNCVKAGQFNACERQNTSEYDGSTTTCDFFGVYDKSWKKIWSMEKTYSQSIIYYDKLLILKDLGIIYNLRTGEEVENIVKSMVIGIVDDICFVTVSLDDKTTEIKALDLKKISNNIR